MKDIQNIFGSVMAISIDNLTNIYEKANMTPEEIADSIKKFPDVIREGIYLNALFHYEQETADRVEKALQIIKKRRISDFKNAVVNGTEKEFLSTIPWEEKTSLIVDMGISRLGIPSEEPLTEEEQQYLDIIEKSIGEDILKKAVSEGFSSVEEWQEYNCSKLSSSKTSRPNRFRR